MNTSSKGIAKWQGLQELDDSGRTRCSSGAPRTPQSPWQGRGYEM